MSRHSRAGVTRRLQIPRRTMRVRYIDDPDDAIDQWEKLLANATRSAFKAEPLQDYSGVDDGPSLQAWLRGDINEAKAFAREMTAPWIEQRRASTARVTRIRITEEPFTPYLEWEIACIYPYFTDTNTETIHLVPRQRLGQIDVTAGDFWIFDESIALEWRYGGRGNAAVGAAIYEDQLDVDRYLAVWNALLAAAKDEPSQARP